MTAERGCARLSTAPCFEFAETGSKLFEHLREILMKFVIRNASASRQLSGYFASMRFDQQQCFVICFTIVKKTALFPVGNGLVKKL